MGEVARLKRFKAKAQEGVPMTRVSVTLRQEEKEALDRMVSDGRMNVSEFVRRLVRPALGLDDGSDERKVG